MLEAVNSVLSNAPANRNAVEQTATSRSFAANPEKTQEAARTPYVSPYISIDQSSNKAVLQIRDSNTGDVVRQFPTEGQLKAYRTAQQFSDRQEAQTQNELREANGAATPQISTDVPVAADVAAPTAPTSIQTEA